MYIKRSLKDSLTGFTPGRINVLYGPRRVGKTTLVKEIFEESTLERKLYTTGDDIRISDILSSRDLNRISDFLEKIDLLVVDEAQRIPDIGLGLKILIDAFPDKKVIVTGSASFELAGQIGEPLTGRKWEYLMYPLALSEIRPNSLNDYELQQDKENQLLFGLYPNVYTSQTRDEKISTLTELVNSLLLKDILELEKVKSSKLLVDLLRLIAFQVGSEVSQAELATNLGIDHKTVGRYLDLFEKSFILFNLRGFARNLRKEVNKMSKYYFYDNGIRNALISNFNKLEERNDVGQLWENFIISERLKHLSYSNIHVNTYFWRTWDQKEVDWIEEREGKLFAYEFKLNPKKLPEVPALLKETYPEVEFNVINQENYLEFVL